MDRLDDYLTTTCTERTIAIKAALKRGYSIDKIHEMTFLDPWFIDQILQIVEMEQTLEQAADLDADVLKSAKKMGFSDDQIGALRKMSGLEIRTLRKELGITPVYSLVDTCAGEFAAATPTSIPAMVIWMRAAKPKSRV